MEQKEEIEKKDIFWPMPRIKPGTFRFEVSHFNQSATVKLKILQKIFGYTSKVRKFLEDFGEHLRPGEKNKPFLISSDFNMAILSYTFIENIRGLKW